MQPTPDRDSRAVTTASTVSVTPNDSKTKFGDEKPPIWHSDDRWNGYNRQGSLDLSLMILDHLAYTGVADPELLTIPIEVVEFYGNLWGASKKNDTDDTMVFFPTQALETWQCPGWPVDPCVATVYLRSVHCI